MKSDGSGYVLGAGAGDTRWFLDTRMTVKAGGAHTGGALTVIEWSAPVGFGPPRHVHNSEDEMFYVLEGELVVECGDQRWTAGPGDFTFLPRGVPHCLHGLPRAGARPAAHHARRFRGLRGGGRPASGGPGLPEPSIPDVPRLVEAGRRHGNDIVGPPLSLDEIQTRG
jgi:quercetin dioxygenase-like cupin family protein